MGNAACRACHAPTDGFLCRPCGTQLARDIGDMPSLLSDLADVVNRQARVYRSSPAQRADEQQHDDPESAIPAYLRTRDGRVTLRATVLPVNLAATELRWEAINTLTTWARDLAESTGAQIAGLWLVWLADNAESFRFADFGPQALDEIGYLHRRLTYAVDRSPSRLYAGPCHAATDGGRCERDLYGWPGADTIECDGHRGDEEGCGADHTATERKDWLTASVTDALLPLVTWQQALPHMFDELRWPPRQTWWRWAETDGKQQQFHAKGRDRVGTPLYRGGDILDVVRRSQERLGTRGGRRSA